MMAEFDGGEFGCGASRSDVLIGVEAEGKSKSFISPFVHFTMLSKYNRKKYVIS
jgi:hypothetical protein